MKTMQVIFKKATIKHNSTCTKNSKTKLKVILNVEALVHSNTAVENVLLIFEK